MALLMCLYFSPHAKISRHPLSLVYYRCSSFGLWQLGALLEQSLGETQHWMHASTCWGGRRSIETLHNRVHLAIGWPMSSVEFAA